MTDLYLEITTEDDILLKTLELSSSALWGLNSKFVIKVLWILAILSDKERQVVISDRTDILKDLGCTKQQFTNALGVLKRKGLITGTGPYTLAPLVPTYAKDKINIHIKIRSHGR
jgi:predicted RNA-binding protein (virulence factor B family)